MRVALAVSSLATVSVVTLGLVGCTASASINRTVSADEFATDGGDDYGVAVTVDSEPKE